MFLLDRLEKFFTKPVYAPIKKTESEIWKYVKQDNQKTRVYRRSVVFEDVPSLSTLKDESVPPSPMAPPRPNRTVPTKNGLRDSPSLPRQPVMAPEADEVYTDPDESGSKPPQINSLPPTTRTNQKRVPAPIHKEEPVAEELYEDPDDKPSGPPIPSPAPQRAPPIGKRSLPALPQEEEENYEDPDSKPQAPPPPRAKGKAAPPPYTKVNIQDKPKPPSLAKLPSRLSMQDDTPDYLEPLEDLPPLPPTRSTAPPPRATLPPPRGGDVHKKPSVPAQEEETYEETTSDALEDYEEPDVVEPPKRVGPTSLGNVNNPSRAPQLLVSNTSRAPPSPVSTRSRAPPPSPSNTSKAPLPSPNNSSMGPPPLISNSSRPPPPPVTNTRARPPLIEQETYEEPDAMKNPPFQEETYEIPEKEEAPVPIPSRTTPSVLTGRSRAPAPIPAQTPIISETCLVPKKSQIPSPAGEDYENEMEKLKAAPKLPVQKRVLPPPPSTQIETPAPQTIGSKEPTEAQLLLQRWYHGSMSRDEAKEKLFSYNMDGMYLIRRSAKNPSQPFTLQIYFAKNDFNLPIRKSGSGYQVGANTQTFPSLLEIVNTFKKSRLVLNQTIQTTLVKSLPKT